MTEREPLTGVGFGETLEHVKTTGELLVRDVRISADQLQDLIAAAPLDPDDPNRRRLRTIALVGAQVVGKVDLDDLVCDRLRLLDTSFDDRLRLRHVTVLGTVSVHGTSFDRVSWGGSFEDEVTFRATTFGPAQFDEATFEESVTFDDAHFGGVVFLDATFKRRLDLIDVAFDEYVMVRRGHFQEAFNVLNTTFSKHVSFGATDFEGEVDFSDSTFEQEAYFGSAVFRDSATFMSVRFQGDATFTRARFARAVQFTRSRFATAAVFEQSTFLAEASFAGVCFGSEAAFTEAVFAEDATFSTATFEQARQFGAVLAGSIDFRDAAFAQPIRIELSAHRLLLDRALFQRGGDVFVRWASVELGETSFSGPSLLTQLPSLPSPSGPPALLGLEQPCEGQGWRCDLKPLSTQAHPRIRSLRGAKVSQLTLSGVDLRGCRFAGAHGLDAMRLERSWFPRTPAGWHWRRRRPRWTRRQTIAEEHDWRLAHGHGHDWSASTRPPDQLGQRPQLLEAEQVAAIYRALRKGREDGKDEPGAADFYYGEMEMRRQAGWMSAARLSEEWAQTPRGTRTVLGAYWLVSGYGLRASRALLALVLLLALLAVPLDLWGFRPDRAYGRALLFAAESSISLLRAPTVKLTASGEVVQLVLRLLGPLLFGLAALSLRGRVKR